MPASAASFHKRKLVREVFENVATRYDLMNDLMSLGAHRFWKRSVVAHLLPRPGTRLLDMAGGTGDMSCHFLRAALARHKKQTRQSQAIIADSNPAMLKAGVYRQKRFLRHLGLDTADRTRYLRHLVTDAEAIAMKSDTVDRYIIAFGLRNVSSRTDALKEAYRVLRPGGLFGCLEFSHPYDTTTGKIYRLHAEHLIPLLGKYVTGHEAAYRYLIESIAAFPTREVIDNEIGAAGFRRRRIETYAGGIAALHLGWKI